MAFKIFLDGGAGTTGLQIADRLASRADISLLVLDDTTRKDKEARKAAMAEADISILCLPDAAAIEAAAMAAELACDVRLIDASSAHRVHPDFVYGFAEMAAGQADKIANAHLVSNPGCYPTSFVALVRPLIQAGLLAPEAGLAAACVSGYSGGGRTMIERYEAGEAPAFGTYGLTLGHKHLPEMKVHSGLVDTPVFLPSVGQFAQGMLVNIPLHQAQFSKTVSAADLTACYRAAYGDSALIKICDETGLDAHNFLVAEALAGRDNMELFVFADASESHFVLTARTDNLGKGAAGAAVQNMNLMLGVDMLSGLQV
ncbi:MAG: N-acetyl-gamma-glutamyl-phosphate reductase [Alphaproteobacteria bacterium]|nr:N-acetyl-gamma-glutamyl-phosphate reductase [Alphaproteobacteria bacterium]MBL6775924.1 N-acetyl-gamma-glutamyl-phosphate reductase [Alphaproteobacteria bacterium]